MKKMFNKMSNTVKTMTCKAHCCLLYTSDAADE